MPSEQEQHSVIWPQDLQDETMNTTVGDDDFSKFLDLDTDFQFTGIDHAQSGLDTPMGRLGFGQMPQDATMQGLGFNNGQQMNMQMSHQMTSASYQHSIPATQQFEPYQQYHHMQMSHGYQVPPTPISSEMHPGKYGQRIDSHGQIIFDHPAVSFTPLVSPAQTPLNGGFNLPQYDNADDFFSPLTSPALEAQNQYTGTTASPVDLNGDPAPKTTSAPRRGRRKASISTRTPGARSVKQSPMVRPQTRRRQQNSSTLSLDKIESLIGQSAQNQSLKPSSAAGNSRSGEESVSPEPLSESSMRPPPVPSSDKSPLGLVPSQRDEMGNPVTPATLMHLPPGKQKTASGSVVMKQPVEDIMEDIMLPDAAAPPPPDRSYLPTLDTNINGEDHDTPVMSAKSAKVSANSTPRRPLAKDESQDSFSKPVKIEGRGTRGSKKRQSTSSAAISPALRPKISPSISPLVPASSQGMGHLSAETSALYLASKSNYQNIIDGTHLPGVSYPEALAENLSSKRTSHKIAEQGRRNRINLALKEIETLLPPAITTSAGKREKPVIPEDDKNAAGIQGASKASTVEMAIIYIKSLQAELKVTREQLDHAEKKLAEGNSSAGSQTSD